MKNKRLMSVLQIVIPLLLLTSVSACADSEPNAVKTTVADAAETTVADVAEATAESLKEDAGTEAERAPWLDIVMDGSSLDAYNQSLEQVRESGGESAYNTMQDSFKRLLFKDIGARNDPEKLASRLDGLTAGQVVKRGMH